MNAPVARVLPRLMLVGFITCVVNDDAECQVPRGHFTDLRKLGPDINTSAVEGLPYISGDGLTLYYSSRRPGGLGGVDLYHATRSTVNDPFGDVTNLGDGINSAANEWIPVISSDGLTLYFTIANNGGPGGFGGDDLFQATRSTTDDAFDNVTNLGPAINTEFHDDSGDISSDGLTLYFSSYRTGDSDLYMATRESISDGFANVTNLGTGVNGSAAEISPRLSANGLVLFFSDDNESPYRSGGHGDADIWVAMRTSINKPFGGVANLNDFSLGSAINGPLHDFFPSISHDWPARGSQLYFHRSGAGRAGDIWQATWVPETLGDFDGFGQLDGADVDRLMRGIAAATNDVRLDLNGDNFVNGDDLTVWVKDLKKTWFGDANLDGEFNTADLVEVFQAGQYEDAVDLNSTWATGDWNGDGDFNSRDLVFAFQDGGFEKGPRAAVHAVPEPSTTMLVAIAMICLLSNCCRANRVI